MRLTALKVRNIRSYASADLAFGPGTTLLVGDVGAGKTSLLYAIEMALFGFAEVDPVHLIRHRSREAEVVLGLSDGSHTYELRRRFSRKSRRGKEVFEADECVYGSDGSVQKYSPTELRQRAIDLLGFPDNPNPRAHSDLWRWAVYIPQERMRDVLAQEPTERRETVRKALGLEQYKTAADNALLLARDIGVRARSLTDRADMLLHFEEDIGRWTGERDRTLVLLDELRRSAEVAAIARRDAETAVETAERDARAIAVERAQLLRLGEEIERLSKLVRSLQTKRNELLQRQHELLVESRQLESELAGRDRTERSREDALAEVDRWTGVIARSETIQRERAAAEASFAGATEGADRAKDELRRALREWESADVRWKEAEGLAPTLEPRSPTLRMLPEIDRDRTVARLELDTALAELAERRPLVQDLESLLASGSCPRCHQAVDAASFGAHRDEAKAAVGLSEARVQSTRAVLDRLEGERSGRERYDGERSAWARAEEIRQECRRNREESHERSERAKRSWEASELHRAESERARSAMPSIDPGAAKAPRALELARGRLHDADQTLSALARAEARQAAIVQRSEELARSLEEGERDRTAQQLALETAGAQHRERGQQLATLDPDQALDHARLGARAASERSEVIGREIARRETELTGWSTRLREAEAGRRRRGELLEEAAAERSFAAFFQGPFRETLTRLEERLLERAQREFERTFSRAFQTLVEDPTIAARTDGAFTPAVEIDGEWTPAEALSGGERTALALAFRIALGQVIRGAGRLRLETLILDEPTDGFSPEQVVRVGELLRVLGLPQVILVSHETGLAAIADRVLRVAKVEGLSVVRAEESPELRPAVRPPAGRTSGEPGAAIPAR